MANNKEKNNGWGEFFTKRVQFFLTLAGVAIALLNIWIASKLAPIAQDIAVIERQVSANEVRLVPRTEIEGELENINHRLDRIENKLDRVIEIH